MKQDFDFVVDGFFGEAIGYKSLSGVPESAASWQSLNAVVERSAEARGISNDLGRSPIIVSISRTDLTSVTVGRDKIRLDADDSRIYLVSEVIVEDAGGWELYCV